MPARMHPAQPRTARERWIGQAELALICARRDSAVVVDRKVAGLYGLSHPSAIQLTAGEEAKSFVTLKHLCEEIGKRRRGGARRVVSVGGGSIGDVVALAAHLVQRGIPLVQVPTTLLAAVDSSIGGKAAVNSDNGPKNVFGAYHFPALCLLCEQVWTTLTPDQHLDGLAEAQKMALCLDRELAYRWHKSKPDIREMVSQARRLKNAVCQRDPFETLGLRTVLNFGHTVGHAVESLSNYEISHGAAVACGIAAALDVGMAIGITPEWDARWAEESLLKSGLPGRRRLAEILREHSWEDFRNAISYDKKGLFNFVLLNSVGTAQAAPMPETVVRGLFDRWREQ